MISLMKRGEMISPARGLWIPVSPEYRAWGGPEAITYIDALMHHLNAEYYVGWMSAAALLGASHHASQVFQVATSKTVANRTIGRSDMHFFMRRNVAFLPTFRFKTQTGFARISTRAATMLSIASDMGLASGPNNAATIIIELSETDETYLQEVADCAAEFPASALRRLGWILDNFTDEHDLDLLEEISNTSETKLSKLSLYDSYSGHVDKKWSLDINTRIEPDV
jgi:predicted transcriptional regulator of viral defense system